MVAAWGRGYGADAKLAKPDAGDHVFYYLDKVGIIAMATFDDSQPFESNDIFRKRNEGEFSRRVIDLVRLTSKAIAPKEILEATGYALPTRGTALKRLLDQQAVDYILSRFR